MKKGMKGSEGSLNSGKKSVGNQIVKSRGYGGGTTSSELIGAKKVSGPKA